MNRYPVSSSADEFLTDLRTISDDDFAALEKVYHYRWVNAFVTRICLIIGGYLVLMVLTFRVGILSLIWLMFGVVTIFLGISASARRPRISIPLYILLFSMMGVLAIMGSFLNIVSCPCNAASLLAPDPSALAAQRLFTIVLAVIEFLAAYSLFRIYRLIAPIDQSILSKDILTLHDHIWTEFASTRYVQNDQRLEVIIGRGRWIGFMFGERAALADTRRKYIFFLDKAELNFAPDEPGSITSADVFLKGKLQLKRIRVRAVIDRTFFEHYQRWKSETSSDESSS